MLGINFLKRMSGEHVCHTNNTAITSMQNTQVYVEMNRMILTRDKKYKFQQIYGDGREKDILKKRPWFLESKIGPQFLKIHCLPKTSRISKKVHNF